MLLMAIPKREFFTRSQVPSTLVARALGITEASPSASTQMPSLDGHGHMHIQSIIQLAWLVYRGRSQASTLDDTVPLCSVQRRNTNTFAPFHEWCASQRLFLPRHKQFRPVQDSRLSRWTLCGAPHMFLTSFFVQPCTVPTPFPICPKHTFCLSHGECRNLKLEKDPKFRKSLSRVSTAYQKHQ